MVIGIDHLHIHNGKFAPYAEVGGPQGPIFEYKGAVIFLAIKATTWLWFYMVICIHHPQHQRYMGGLVQAYIDVLESSSFICDLGATELSANSQRKRVISLLS